MPDTRLRRLVLLVCLFAVPVASASLLRPPLQASAGQESDPHLPVRLSRGEAARLASEIRARLTVEVADGLDLTLWAAPQLVADPVAMDIDARGTVWVTSSERNDLPLDIRQHRDWMTIAHTLRTLDDLRAFYRRVMAPERSAQNTWIDDLNQDGSRDIHDLAEMKERIYRLRDTDGDGFADESLVVFEGFNEDPTWDIAGGILHHEGDLIVGVPPGVYRLRDTNGDGSFDRQTTISEGFATHPTYGGHGVSGVMRGPDGRLYWEVGDMGMHLVDETGRTWAYPNQGVVARSELDGSGFEVVATGIRNLQEFAFDDHGNLISVDNDGDHAGETERLVYLPYGTDSGWRSNWQYGKYTDPKNNRYNVWMAEGMFKPRHAGQTAHILPPIAPWHAGPSGMVYNPGTALSEAWRHHFFVTSFPGAPANARIWAFTLKEDGAGFAMDQETQVLRGILSVGLAIGPEGALYLTDWDTGWDSNGQGRLWTLDVPGGADSPIRREVQALLVEDFTARPLTDLAPLLRHADMRIRQKAQFEIVGRGDVDTLVAAARDRRHHLARLHGIWGIAQLARQAGEQHAAHLPALLHDEDGEVRAQAAKMIGDVRYRPAADRLLPLLMDTAPRARFFAAEALGRLAHAPAAPALVEMLEDNDGHDMYIQHAGSLALASIGNAAALESLSSHSSRAVRTAALIALGRLRHPGVARFLADSDTSTVVDAARAINDDGSIPAAVPQLAAMLGRLPDDLFAATDATAVGQARRAELPAPAPVASDDGSPFRAAPPPPREPRAVMAEAIVRRAINANLRIGTPAAVTRVEAFAADASRDEDLRAEAIAALGVWPAPSPLDRVDGYYLDTFDVPENGQETARRQRRDGAAARAAVTRLIDAHAARGATPAPAVVSVALADAAGQLGIRAAAPVLLTQLRSGTDPSVRLAALQALQKLKVGDMREVMRIALRDEDSTVRRGALAVLPDLSISAGAKAEFAASVVSSGSTAEQQGAIEVLGALGSRESRRVLEGYLDDLIAGRIEPDLHIDLLSAVQADGSPALVGKLETYQQARGADSLIAAFRDGAVRGGDARRGRLVFQRNPQGQCTRCHVVRGSGSDVGPDLTRIGSELSREQLLEALIEPNARIAPGFGVVGLTLHDGERVDGTLRDESDTHLVVLTGDPPAERRIPKTAVAERTDPLSAMPPLGLVLEPLEVRDLVEYLAGLR